MHRGVFFFFAILRSVLQSCEMRFTICISIKVSICFHHEIASKERNREINTSIIVKVREKVLWPPNIFIFIRLTNNSINRYSDVLLLDSTFLASVYSAALIPFRHSHFRTQYQCQVRLMIPSAVIHHLQINHWFLCW